MKLRSQNGIISVYVDHESQWFSRFKVSLKTAIKPSVGKNHPFKVELQGIHFHIHIVISRTQFFLGCWSESPQLETISSFLKNGHYMGTLTTWYISSSGSKSIRANK